jgi:hypothetical protein
MVIGKKFKGGSPSHIACTFPIVFTSCAFGAIICQFILIYKFTRTEDLFFVHLFGFTGNLTKKITDSIENAAQTAGNVTQTAKGVSQTAGIVVETAKHVKQTAGNVVQTAEVIVQTAKHVTQTAKIRKNRPYERQVWPDETHIWPFSSQVWPDETHIWPCGPHVWPDETHVWPGETQETETGDGACECANVAGHFSLVCALCFILPKIQIW